MEIELWFIQTFFHLSLPLCIPYTSLINCLSHLSRVSRVPFLPLQFSSPLPTSCAVLSPTSHLVPCPGQWARAFCQWFAFLPLILPQGYSTLTTIAGKITASAWSGFHCQSPHLPDLAAPMWCDFSHQVLFSFSLTVFARNAMNLITHIPHNSILFLSEALFA